MLWVAGCMPPTDAELTVYTALDQDFSEPILDAFTESTGIQYRAKFDTESTKTVTLFQTLLAERNRPRCDVFWNNEILHTLRLDQENLLTAYFPPVASNYPPMYRSAQGTWHGFAARARVLLVNKERVTPAEYPVSILDLTDPKWKGVCGIAKPLFGTTATHAACLFAAWGDERAQTFFADLKENARVMSGNRQVARAVGSGQLKIGWTDTDDAIIELESARPVHVVYPDQQTGGMGTLFIPNTLAIIRNGPHPKAAQQLVDYLLAPQVEARLATGRSAQIPLNPRVNVDLRVETPATIRAMQVDFTDAAKKWDTAAQFLRDLF